MNLSQTKYNVLTKDLDVHSKYKRSNDCNVSAKYVWEMYVIFKYYTNAVFIPTFT